MTVKTLTSDRFKALYPFASHFVDLGGIRYHYVDEGQGEPIVMVHGNAAWSFYYRHLLTDLRRQYRVIAPDHVGCGRSDKPSPRQYEFTLDRRIRDLEALLRHLGLRDITFVVHDWGGPIGMGYAVRHPETVKRFVIFNTAVFLTHVPSGTPIRIPKRIHLSRAPLIGEFGVCALNLFVGLAPKLACAHQERMTPAVKAAYIAPYPSYASRLAMLRFVRDIPDPRNPAVDHHPSYRVCQEIIAGLAQFRQHPMLLVWGERDFFFDEAYLRSWIALFPHAMVKRIPDAAHWVVEDAHERILPWMHEFLRQHPLAVPARHAPPPVGPR